MLSKIRELIDTTRFHRQLVADVAALLPGDDGDLDRWIADALAQSDQLLFFYIVLAAVSIDRSVDSRHLVKGTVLIEHYTWIGIFAFRMHGAVGDHLVSAVQTTRLSPRNRANALLIAAHWYRDQQPGNIPPSLISEARRIARENPRFEEARAWLFGIAHLIQDDGLTSILEKTYGITFNQTLIEAAEKFAISSSAAWKCSVILQLPEAPRPQAIEGFTMRRAVARISRNESCPCGSGKKYKRCCSDKDHERLRHSSDIAGKTHLELQAELEPHLTQDRLAKLPAHAIARLDPLKIRPDILDRYFWFLGFHRLYERAAEAFEQIGYTPELQENWQTLLWNVTKKGDRDLIRRVARLHPDDGNGDDHLFTSTVLILLEDDPAKMLDYVEECILTLLTEEATAIDLHGFAIHLLYTRFRLFGIFVARSMIPLAPKTEAIILLDHILETRDHYNLSPEDPYGEILERRFAVEPPESGKDSAALREAQRKLETKAAEVRRMKDDLEKLRREVERREKQPSSPTHATAHAAPSVSSDEKGLAELRDKVTELKSHLNQRHLERADLRRELVKAHSELDNIRQKPERPSPEDDPLVDQEDLLLVAADLPDHQPLRLLEFPRKFHHTLESLPRQVSRAALVMLGRLAAGEPAAYVGVVRLKETVETLRQRIGIDHRLLFRLHPEHVEVVDLINRRDLARRIKNLREGAL